jgi:hypothetical protein
MSVPQRSRLADELSRRLAAAIRGAQLYSPAHPLVTRSARALIDTLTLVHQSTPSVAIGDRRPRARRRRSAGPASGRDDERVDASPSATRIERIVIDKGVEEAENPAARGRRRQR